MLTEALQQAAVLRLDDEERELVVGGLIVVILTSGVSLGEAGMLKQSTTHKVGDEPRFPAEVDELRGKEGDEGDPVERRHQLALKGAMDDA